MSSSSHKTPTRAHGALPVADSVPIRNGIAS
jgi:hypothetical protein